MSAVELAVLWSMPETAQRKARAVASLRPHVSVPVQARQALLQVTPVNIAAWALGGFYFSLMPSLVRAATGATLPIVGGLVGRGFDVHRGDRRAVVPQRRGKPAAARWHSVARRGCRHYARRCAEPLGCADAFRYGGFPGWDSAQRFPAR